MYAFSLMLSVGMLVKELHAHTRLFFGLGLLLTLLLLQGWHPALSTFWNTPAWTMSTEAFFYLFFPWRSAPAPSRLTMLVILFAVGSAGWCCRRFTCLHPGWRPPPRPLLGRILDAGAEIHAAAAPAFLPLRHGPGMSERADSPREPQAPGAGMLPCALYLLLCVGERLPYVFIHDGLLMPLFADSSSAWPGRILARFFGLLPFIAIGEASYCLYLLHFNLWTLIHDSGFLQKTGLIVFDPWFVPAAGRCRAA